MRLLVVGSNNYHNGGFAPFIIEQADALRAIGCDVDFFGVKGKGIKGYLGNMKDLKSRIEDFRPDIVHAHYGLCGLLACLTVKSIIPSFHHFIISPKVVTTYHGSDINDPKVLPLSKIAMRLSAWNIFISQKTMDIAINNQHSAIARKSTLIPCGINMPPEEVDLRITNALLYLQDKVLERGKKHVLFAGAFSNAVKDPQLAMLAVEELRGKIEDPVQLVELKGFSRNEVNALMYACDAILMTSKTEGSPQVIKEAMACGLPIVSVDVGDVKERLIVPVENGLLLGCYVAKSREPVEIAELLKKALLFGKRTNGRKRIEEMELRNEEVAKELIDIYCKVNNVKFIYGE